ncbi:MAG TPA: hypothetical protein VER96_18070 [Polyangiaceae bacterium]|nr:hypothetical protein [Polyangiaceae bacterium]
MNEIRVARWWRSRNQINLELARKWAPDIQPGEMLGIRFGYREADR